MIFDEFRIKKKVEIQQRQVFKPEPTGEADIANLPEGEKLKLDKLLILGRKDFYIYKDNKGQNKECFLKVSKLENEYPPFILLKSEKDNQHILIYEFFIQNISEQRREKFHIGLMTGDQYSYYFFGGQPLFITISGSLLNYQDPKNAQLGTGFDWREKFIEIYETKLRGSKLIENGYKFYLFYENVYICGYPLDLQISQSSAMENITPFVFNILAIQRVKINIGIMNKNAS